MPPKMKDDKWYKLEVQVVDGQDLPPGEDKAFLKELANALACAENEMRVETDQPDDYEPPGVGGAGAAAFSAVTAADAAAADPVSSGDVVVTEPTGAADAPTDEDPLPEPAPPPTAPAPAPAPGGGVQPMYFCHNKGV